MFEYLESPAGAAMLGRVFVIVAIVGLVWWLSARRRARENVKTARQQEEADKGEFDMGPLLYDLHCKPDWDKGKDQ